MAEGIRLRISLAAEVLEALDKAIECEQNLRGVVKFRADLLDEAAREWLSTRGYPVGKSRLRDSKPTQVKPLQVQTPQVQTQTQAPIQPPVVAVSEEEMKSNRAWVKKYCRDSNQARKTPKTGESHDA